MSRVFTYRDAIGVLGGDPQWVKELDKALDGTLSVVTGGVSGPALSLVNLQGRILGASRKLLIGLRDKANGAGRVDRTRLLQAAHAVIVVTAYFEAFDAAQLPFDSDELEITWRDQIWLSGGSPTARDFLRELLAVEPPRPAPHVPYEDFREELRRWYWAMSTRLMRHIERLAVWDRLTSRQRNAAEDVLVKEVHLDAVDRFDRMFRELARDMPEFGYWTGQIEHQATRFQVRKAMNGIETILAAISATESPAPALSGLDTAYRAILERPPLVDGHLPAGIRIPSLADCYLDPDFRVRAVSGDDRPVDEAWWSSAAVRSDLTEYLVGTLASPDATAAPIVVLAQPGAGKSVLTNVLAARLVAPDFLVVRVPLRSVPADAEVQDQVEAAIRETTGERAHWPEMVRASGAALRVLLLDGFDELLQATGVSQSDYLEKVARFQQREADQRRPVVVIVTSRLAVADRARYPPGTVAVRLEPFRDNQIEEWLRIWNRYNEAALEARGLCALPPDIAVRHAALASQPLLLLMLALYDADTNALQREATTSADAEVLDETTLYEELLVSFARREVAKSDPALDDAGVARQVEQELQRLSLVGLAMVNRRQQWVSGTELNADLTALLGTRPAGQTQFRAPLTPADIALGKFFFVQRAQAVRDGATLQTFEFLHATFGEFLVARLAVQLAIDLLGQQSELTFGSPDVNDDRLYALYSFATLSTRQMLRFVQGVVARRVMPANRRPLTQLLLMCLRNSAGRTEHKYSGYAPGRMAVAARHGIYSANLVLLMLAVTGELTASELFPDALDPADQWHRAVLLWRSSLDEAEWTDLAMALNISRDRQPDQRQLKVRLAGHVAMTVAVDPYWHYGRPARASELAVIWHRPYAAEVLHKMDVSSGTNDAAVLHALEPVLWQIGHTVLTYVGLPGSRAHSVAHTLLNLWLARALPEDAEALATMYQECVVFLNEDMAVDRDTKRRVALLVLNCLRDDVRCLPAAHAEDALQAIMSHVDQDTELIAHIRQIVGS